MAADPLDTALGPILTTWETIPFYGKIAVVAAVGMGYLIYRIWQDQEPDQLEAADMKERVENTLIFPVESHGAKINDLLIVQSNSSKKRTVGAAKKVYKTSTKISDKPLDEEDIEELEEKVQRDSEEEKEDIELDHDQVSGVTYAVVKGEKRIDRIFNTILYKVGGIFSKGRNPFAEYYDLKISDLEIDDRGIIVKPDVHLVKKNGLWHTNSYSGRQRVVENAFSDSHLDWVEVMQKLPEFYSDLNMDVSGKKNIMNTKSENIQEFKKNEKIRERQEGMEE